MQDIPTPFSELQALSLDGPQARRDLIEAFKRLGSEPPADPDAFLTKARELGREALPAWARERAIESVPLEHGRFLGWGEGLDHLEDQERVGDVELGLTHRALEAQQQPVVEVTGIVDAVLVEDERVGERADLEEPMPVGGAPREPRDFQAHDE